MHSAMAALRKNQKKRAAVNHPRKKGTKGGDFDVDTLPWELWEDIFLRLSVFSFYTLKCVSKAFKNLISEAEASGKVPTTTSAGFFQVPKYSKKRRWKYLSLPDEQAGPEVSRKRKNKRKQDLDIEFLPCYNDPSFRIAQACSGMLLCSSTSIRTVIYYVCNPLTKAWIQLPARQREPSWCILMVAFFTDPCISSHFKVVRLMEATNGTQKKVDVFCSKTRQWHEFIAPLDLPRRRTSFNNEQPCVYLRGVLYVMTFKSDIVGLELEAERLISIRQPATDPIGRFVCFMREFNGQLHFIHLASGDGGLRAIMVWKLEHHHSSRWVLVSRNTTAVLSPRWGFLPCVVHPELEVIYIRHYKTLLIYSYHLVSRRWEKICDHWRVRSAHDDPIFYLKPHPVKFL